MQHSQLLPPVQQQQQQQQERVGSRLGQGAPAAAAGAPAGGLSARPSEQSLEALLGGREPDTHAGDGAAGTSGERAQLAQQTAERRRLNLDALDSPAAAAGAAADGAGLLYAAGVLRQQQQLTGSISSGGGGVPEEAEGGAPVSAPISAPASSSMLLGLGGVGSQQQPGGDNDGASRAVGLTYAASVDLIDAPITDMESEQAELL